MSVLGRSVTLQVIAKRLGVSVQTVSNALRSTGRVSGETAERIRAEASDLGYRPHVGAQAMRGARTRTLSVILCDTVLTRTPSTYLGYLIPLLASSIRDVGYTPHIQFGENNNYDEVLQPVRNGLVDGGIMLANAISDAQITELARENLPLVLFERGAPAGTLPFVSADYADGIAQAVAHVYALGARTIAYLDGRPHWPNTSSIMRYQGYILACASLGISSDLVIEGDWRFEAGQRAFKQLQSRETLPDAVVCANDQMAIGLLRAAQEHGLSVPEDMMITGFDDIEFASYTTPQLTTVHLPLAALARSAAQRLAATVDGSAAGLEQGITLPTQLAVRASTGSTP